VVVVDLAEQVVEVVVAVVEEAQAAEVVAVAEAVVAEGGGGGGTPPECGEPLQPLAGRINVMTPAARAGCRIMEMETLFHQNLILVQKLLP
jgi:hypothetical protein